MKTIMTKVRCDTPFDTEKKILQRARRKGYSVWKEEPRELYSNYVIEKWLDRKIETEEEIAEIIKEHKTILDSIGVPTYKLNVV